MSTLKVTQAHSLDPAAAKQALGPFEADIAKYGMKIVWKGNEADLKGTGASGSISVTPANVTVTIKLGMLAKAAGVKADKLEKSIEKRLRTALVGEP